MVSIKCNTPIQVNRRSYKTLSTRFSGIVAHRMVEDSNEVKHYWIKVLMMSYLYLVEDFIQIKQ